MQLYVTLKNTVFRTMGKISNNVQVMVRPSNQLKQKNQGWHINHQFDAALEGKSVAESVVNCKEYTDCQK